MRNLGKFGRKFQLIVEMHGSQTCVWETTGGLGTLWGHHKILISLVTMLKWGTNSPAENVHPLHSIKPGPWVPLPGTLRLSTKPVPPPGAWAVSYRAWVTLAACNFLSLCLVALHVTCGTPGLDTDECHPGLLCKESCPLWVPVSWL